MSLASAASAAGTGPSAAASGTPGAAQPPGTGETKTVTLITGDRVRLDGTGRVVDVRPGKGREGVAISVRRVRDHVHVVPVDAGTLIARGVVDRRLFDVTGLVQARYDDAHRASTPLIIAYAAATARGRSAVAAAGGSIRRSLPVIGGDAVAVPKSSDPEAWEALTAVGGGPARNRAAAPGIERIWLDGVRRASLDRSVPQIGAPAAWAAGYDGTGVKVAVLDTGVDETHPDLSGVEVGQKNFSGAPTPVDHAGHGTHVASTVAGSGAKAGGRYRGVAPGARILDGKVLDDSGRGPDSGILAGMQWAVDEGAKVVNLSLGAGDSPETDPLEEAVNRLSADNGVLFVVSAGNAGPRRKSLGSPGTAAAALTVGAVDREDGIGSFSSVGPTADGRLKPDITAPGVDIVAAKAAQGVMGAPVADGYVSMSGTSMAAPHVAGAAALLAQQHPDWTGERIKQVLAASAKPAAGVGALRQGTGRTDLTRAIVQTVVTEQTSVSFGVQQWPHDDDKPATRNLTYRNDGADPVTLDLSAQVLGPDGGPAPDGLFTVAPSKITVPAGGTAEAAVTVDTRIGTVDGDYSGAVVATGGGQTVRTAVAVEREVESYTLTLTSVDDNGAPAEALTRVVGVDTDVWEQPADADGDGTVRVRLPKGEYLLDVPVLTPNGTDTPDLSWFVRPSLSFGKDTALTFDGRDAKPVKITPPDPATLGYVLVNHNAATEFGEVWGTFFLYSFDGIKLGRSGPAVAADRFDAQIAAVWAAGDTRYDLLYDRTGSFYDGFTHATTRAELARVDVTVGDPAAGQDKSAYSEAVWGKPGEWGYYLGMDPVSPPAAVRHYLTKPTIGYLKWSFRTEQINAADEAEVLFESDPTVYKPGRTYATTFGVGVFGPSVGRPGDSAGAFRAGDDLFVCVPTFTDGAGNLGHSVVTEARTVITAGDQTIVDAKSPPCTLVREGLPAAATRYRISTDVSRSTAVTGVSTRIVADWTYTSRAPAGTAVVEEPLSTVRFTPELSLGSTARAGTTARVPLVVEGPADKNLKSLSVQVSYDGGTTWTDAPVTTRKGKRYLTLTHPESATSVSFRSDLADKRGNTHAQTIYTAYRLVS
jgi:hypothetical protein